MENEGSAGSVTFTARKKVQRKEMLLTLKVTSLEQNPE